jgi:hypothetical protein
MPDRPIGELGLANYVLKENWRRDGEGKYAEERVREGWKYFWPNAAGAEAGQKMVDWCMAELAGMVDGSIPLLDSTGTVLQNNVSYTSYPNNDTLNSEGVAGPQFTMDKVF